MLPLSYNKYTLWKAFAQNVHLLFHIVIYTARNLTGLLQQKNTYQVYHNNLQQACSCTKTGTRQVKASEYWLIDNKLQQGCLQIQLVRFWPVYMHGAMSKSLGTRLPQCSSVLCYVCIIFTCGKVNKLIHFKFNLFIFVFVFEHYLCMQQTTS